MKNIWLKYIESIQGQVQAMRHMLQNIKQEDADNSERDDSQVAGAHAGVADPLTSHRHFWFAGLVVVAIGFFVYTILDWVLLMFTGVVIAIAMETTIGYFENKTKRRRLGITLSYLILLGLLLSGILIMVPFLVNQMSDIIAVIVKEVSHLEASIKLVGLGPLIEQSQLYGYLKSFGLNLTEPRYLAQLQSIVQDNISAIISFSSSYAKDAGSIVFSTVSGALSTITQIGFVLTLSVLLSIEKTAFTSFLYHSTRNISSAQKKIGLLYSKLGFWLKTQILLGIYIGVTMRIALLILSLFGIYIPNQGSLAVIAALTELIPYVGPLLGGVPVLILATVQNGRIGFLGAGIAVFCVQRIENNILIPLLFKKNLGVSPVLTFLCMVVLGVTMGINGVILAIPVSVMITVFYNR